MAAPIASLVVRISGQISELQKSFDDGLGKVTEFKSSFEKSAASIQGTIDGIGKSFESFGSVVGTLSLGVAGVTAAAAGFAVAFNVAQRAAETVVGAIEGVITKTADLGDELLATSLQTGLSVESLSALKFVAGQANTSLDQITNSVFKLEANLGKGTKETADAVKALGLSFSDLRKAAPEEAFATVLAKLNELPNQASKAAAGMALFGRQFKDISQLATEDIEGLVQQAKDLGLVLSTETAVAGDRFNDALGAIRGSLEGVALQIGAKVLPAAVALVETFGGVFTDAIRTAAQSSGGLGEAFDTLVVQIGRAIGRVIEILARLTDATAAWVVASTQSIAKQYDAFLSLVPAIVQVGKAIDLLQSGGQNFATFDKIRADLESLRGPLDATVKLVAGAGDRVRAFAQGLGTAAASAGENFGAIYARIQSELSVSADRMRASLKGVGDGGVEGAARAKDAFSSLQQQLNALTAQITRATQNKTALSELVRLFGDEAAKAVPKARAFGLTVTDSVEDVARAFNQAKLTETLSKLDDKFRTFFDSRAQAQFKKLQAEMRESARAIVELPKSFEKLDDAFERSMRGLTTWGDRARQELHDQTPQIVAELTNPFREAFADLATSLPQTLSQALRGGGGFGQVFAALGQDAAGTFLKIFTDALNREKGAPTGKEWAAGAIGIGLQQFSSGLLLGSATTDRAAAALGGFVQGGLSGFAVGGPVGFGVGGAAGAIGAVFGAQGSKDQQRQLTEESRRAFVQQFGGLERLQELADKAGASLRGLFNAANPQQLARAIGIINDRLTEYENRLKSIQTALGGVNDRALVFASNFGDLIARRDEILGGRDASALGSDDASRLADVQRQIAEEAAATQPQFERLGIIVRNVFGAIVSDSGDAIGAMRQLAPAFQTLQAGVTDFGLTSTAAIDDLLASFALINDEALGPFIEAIQASGAVLSGLFDANALRPDAFQALAADIGASLAGIEAQGGDMARALALSQPVLQDLWEAQQRLGTVTDETTQRYLEQAEQQELVGDAMRDVNDQILQVLVAIGNVLGATIPDGIGRTRDELDSMGSAVSRATGSTVQSLEGVGTSLDGLAARAASAGVAVSEGLAGGAATIAPTFEAAASDAAERMRTRFSEGGIVPPDILAEFEAAAARARDRVGDIGGAMTDLSGPAAQAAAAIDAELQAKLQATAADIETTFGNTFADLARDVGPILGDALTDLEFPAGEAGDRIRLELWRALQAAGRDVRTIMGGSLRGLDSDAQDAADAIEDILSRIRVDTIRVPVEIEAPSLPEGATVPALAHGGIVRRPTLALVGEAGPEAVIPLSRLPERGAHSTIVIEVDGRAIAEATVPHIPGVVRRLGVSR